MLRERYPYEKLRRLLVPTRAWRPFPRASERGAWDALLTAPLNQKRKAYLVGLAEAAAGAAWPALPAALYMDFARTGTRVRFETPYFERRTRLGTLVLAECLEGRGRFLDEIVNGLWLILEESTWCLPAHTGGLALPLPDTQYVDLFACETAMVLSEALYLLEGELERAAPAIPRRIRDEVIRRVIEPSETRSDFWWFNGRNNWTPWCCANALGAAMIVLDDEERLARFVARLMGPVDAYVGRHAPDGGCDEGPMYWGVGAGALLLFLEHLHSRSNGAVTVYDEPLVANMGRYVCSVHLDGPWFFNIGDGGAHLAPPRAVVYRYGERTGVPDMQSLAKVTARGGCVDGAVDPLLQRGGTGATLTHGLRELFWMPADEQPVTWRKPLSTWLADLQVMTVRERPVPGQGLVLAAKAGNNDASHNHNDVGQFVLWLNGAPVIIDLGVESYTRKTFSPERYDLWTIRSSSHNVPLVNGIEQAAGAAFKAADVRYVTGAAGEELSMELREAYPAGAGIAELHRDVRFERGRTACVVVCDRFALTSVPVRFVVPLFTPADVQVAGPCDLRLVTAGGSVAMCVTPGNAQISVSRVEITDARLRGSWPAWLTRIDVVLDESVATGSCEMRFTPVA